MAKIGRPRRSSINRYEAEIRLLLNAGRTVDEIARLLKVCAATVYRFCKLNELPLKRGKKSKPETIEKYRLIISRYLENYSLKECGDKFGISSERVRQILNAAGIKPRPYTLIIKPFAPKKVLTSRERFWSFVDKSDGENSCWEWRGYLLPNGYGWFSYRGKSHSAHRIAYLFANKKSPKLWVLHSCDNPSCVNPKHLREGTPKENTADRDARGRSAYLRDPEGWLNKVAAGKCCLNEQSVIDIRRRLADNETICSIAKSHNVNWQAVKNIKLNKTKAYENFL